MIIETNIVVNETNKNGRLYTKKVFKESIDKYISGNPLIYIDSSSTVKSDLMKAIGKIEGYEIINNIVQVNGKFLNTPDGKIYEEFYKSGNISITSAGYGKVNGDGLVEDFILKGFHIIEK